MPLPASLEQRLRLPVVAAPMFLISNPQLVLACCGSGVVGSFPALNQRDSAGFKAWLEEIEAGLAQLQAPAPYAVNLIVHPTNPRLQADLALCVEHRVPIVITSLGAVKEVVDAVHGYGGLVFHDVTTRRHAEKAAEAGVDGLIAVAAGAGGHAGTWSPFALVAEIRQFFDKTLLLAGCINHGHEVLAAQLLGADLAYMGTRFIATQESHAQNGYKQMLLDAQAADIIHTPAVSGIPASFLRPSLEQAGYDMAALKSGHEQGKLKPIDDEAKAWKTVWSAGQGVGEIHDLPAAATLIERLRGEYRDALAFPGIARQDRVAKGNNSPGQAVH
ncbi:nitronate monooxygenase family protein [Pseudomonas sp. LRP2-20]|uniref:NAD(P)H-dependent flavin oxidoreductase n=1 Tax=Pseudomonas sp. LRP2-20 TaxID=2944234 RepID=UPI00218B7094|nr:nitronate monooxygenase family protein [Pseudomonas sp. LRP2-20]BDM25124.1 nitronate monooxygenase family protein [Pseudomonas sp. LRP2-20]